MQSKATSVEQYLAELPEERRAVISTIRRVILDSLPEGYAEGMQYGMIGYFVPHAIYPAGYRCDPRQPLPFAGLAAQKNNCSLYLMCVYGSEALARRFRERWEATGKKLDMGKSCVRFKRVEDVPLEVVAEVIGSVPVDTYIAIYEHNMGGVKRSKPTKAVGAKSKPAAKTPAAKPAKKAAKTIAKKASTKTSTSPASRRARGST